MKKSLLINVIMLFICMTVNAQDYKNQSFIQRQTCQTQVSIFQHLPTQHLSTLIMTSVSTGGVAR